MKIDTINYSFFELYGLADLIVAYYSENDNDIFNKYHELTSKELIDFYENIYKNILKEKYCVYSLDGINFNYGQYQPNLSDGQFCSSHVNIHKYKANYDKLFDPKKFNKKTMDLSISPYTTKVCTEFKAQYQIVESFFALCSLITTITPNKYCYYDSDLKSNVSFLPEFDEFEQYLNFLLKIRSNIINDGNKLMKTSKIEEKKINRPQIMRGNFGKNLRSTYDIRFKFVDMLIKISSLTNDYKDIHDISNIKKWYKVTHESVNIININNDLYKFIFNNKYNWVDILNEFIKYNQDSSKKSKDVNKRYHELFWVFLKKFNFNSLNNMFKSIDKFTLNIDNILIEYFFNKNLKLINMEKRNIIKDFCRNINGSLYYSCKDFYEKKGNSSKENINNRKYRMLNEVQNMLNRNKTVEDYLSSLSLYYKKHNIHNSIMLVDLLELNLDYNEFKSISNIYLRCYETSKEIKLNVETEKSEDIF